MPGPETLLTVAELALALAGFAGLVAAFQSGSIAAWGGFDRTRFSGMIELALGTALLALVPICLHALGASEATAWRIATALLAIFAPIHFVVMVRRFRRAAVESPNNLPAGSLVQILLRVSYAGVLIAGLLGASGLAPGFGAHLLGLLPAARGGGLQLPAAAHVGARRRSRGRAREERAARGSDSERRPRAPPAARRARRGAARAAPGAARRGSRRADRAAASRTGVRETPSDVRALARRGRARRRMEPASAAQARCAARRDAARRRRGDRERAAAHALRRQPVRRARSLRPRTCPSARGCASARPSSR